MHPILKKLSGGDRRSIGRSNEIVNEVLAHPAQFRRLFQGMTSDDPIVRMRAADATEKIAAQQPGLLQPFKRKVLAVAGSSDQQEVRWHAAQMIPRLSLTTKERAVAVDILFDYLHDQSSIVKTFAMQGLAALASTDSPLRAKILPLLEELTEIGTPAMRARGRKLLKHLKGRRAKA
jgi:hypothetical protein